MKQLFTLFSIFLFSLLVQGQCTGLFFSEYVEGWSNNKGLEIYNPTNESIDLSAYSISRYSNGGTSPSTTQLTGTIEAYGTFVVGLDKRDPDGEGYEAPMWDGYYTYIDSISGEEVTIYDADTDMQSKVDLFVNPIYYFGTNADSAAAFPTSLYFNGNDAITLEMLGSGIVLDLIGKVGEDPGAAWSDNDGNYWTKDHTLIRKPFIYEGVSMNPTIFEPGLEWDSLPANTFLNLGSHDCDCNVNSELIEHENTFVVAQNDGIIKILNNLPINYIKIYDINGKVVFQKTINQLNKIELDKHQANGIYFISLIDTNGIKTKSIVLLDE